MVPTKYGLLITHIPLRNTPPCFHGSSCRAYNRHFTISETGLSFLPMRNVLWDSAVTKTIGIHPNLISLIITYGLEYHIYELFFDISDEINQESPG